jgi:hypothetical protein
VTIPAGRLIALGALVAVAVAAALCLDREPRHVWRVPRVDSPDASYVAEVRALPWNGAVSVSDTLGRYVGYSTSRNDHDGYHTLTVLDALTGAVRRVVTIRESDPGSGRSHWLGWSADGRALLVGGRGSLDGETSASLCLIYLPASDELYRPAACEQ